MQEAWSKVSRSERQDIQRATVDEFYKQKTHWRRWIGYEGLRPDTDPIYKRGWTFFTGRNLSRNLPGDEPSDTNEDEEERT